MCKKEICPYFREDDFKASVGVCGLSSNGYKFKKQDDVICIVDDEIEYAKLKIDILERFKYELEKMSRGYV